MTTKFLTMKNLLFAVIFLLGAGSVSGQAQYKKSKPQFGAKISVGKMMASEETTYVGNPFDFINHEVNYEGSNAVKNIGLFYQQKFGYLFLRSELGFTQYQQRYQVRSFVQVADPQQYATDKFQFVDFQVMAGLNADNFRFGAGPVAHIMAGNSTDLGFISGFESKTRPVTYGFVTGVGYDAGHLHLDVRYEIGFRNVGDHLYYVNRMARSTQKAHILSFTVGVSI